MLDFSIKSLRVFIIFYVCTFTMGCGAVDWWYGKDTAQIHNEIDTNNDGKVSKEEIKASKYDLNKDGDLSVEEMLAATKGSDVPEKLFGILAALNIPFAGAGVVVLKKLKENKSHVKSLVGGIEDLVNLKKDGYTKEDIYAALAISAKQRGNVKALTKVVKEIKDEIRVNKSHL